MRALRRKIPLLLAATAALALAATAIAGDSPVLKGSKKRNGNYQVGTISVDANSARKVYVKVISHSNNPVTATIFENTGGPGQNDFSISWFKGRKDVSHDMQTAGHEFKLKPGQTRLFRATIKPDTLPSAGMCLYPSVDVGGGPVYGLYFAVNNPSACV